MPAVPSEVTTGVKEIYSPFYISPKTRISDGRRRKAGLMNIQEQRSAELDSVLVGTRREGRKEGEGERERRKKIEWSAREEAGERKTRGGGEIEDGREKMP